MPGYAAIKCRLVVPVGHRYTASWSWKDTADHTHSTAHVDITPAEYRSGLGPLNDLLWATGRLAPCEICGKPPPPDECPSSGSHRVWGTEDGQLHPGDMYWATWMHHDGKCPYWDDCTDPRGHLHVVLPNGHHWDVDSRCSNCALPQDRAHRCWVRTGEPPNITVGKGGGRTCQAGGGSILSSDYHGFLRNGVLTAG